MFGVGFLPYPSVFDKTFSTHYFNGGKQEKMKKRLLSMLMAVLMIVSLVPGMALADTEYVIDIKADAAAKQPGIKVAEVKTGDIVTGYNVEIKAFAKLADICDADKHVPVTKELIVADCGKAGLTVTYCSACGKDLNKNVVTEPLHHDCEFTVVAAPVCAKADGWGYAVCKKCGNPIAVDKLTDFTKLVEQGKTESAAAYAKRVADVAKLFTAADAHDYQTVTADIVVKENGKDVVKAYAGVEATHVAMLVENNNFVNLNNQWKDGGYISTGATGYAQLVKDGKVIAVTGNMTEAGVACTKCGDIQSPGVKDKANTNLNVAHAKYITVTDPGKRPVMFTDGSYKDGKAATYFCSKCGKTFGGEVLSAVKWFNITETAMPKIGDVKVYEGETVYQLVGKNIVVVPATELNKAVAATCQKAGNTGDIIVYTASGVADKDGKIPAVWMLKEVGKKIDKIDHHFVAKPDKLATCDKPGEHYVGIYVCDNVIGKENGKDVLCNQVKHDVIHYTTDIPAAHTPTVVVLVEATCQHDGLSVLQCSVCKKYLNVTMTNDGYEYAGTVAAAGTAPAYVVKQVKHMAAAELKDAKEATCTEVGYTGDKVCKWCGIMLEKGKEIPMKEHTVVDVAAVEATCTADGMTAGTKCSVCGTVLSGCEVVKALGHDFKDGKCTRCGEKDPNYVPPVVNPFKDVEKSSPYYDAIIWAADKGVTTGKTADTFGINDGCTRAQIVTFLYRAAGSPAVKADTVNPFTDVSKDSVYYNAILWAVEKGITKGTTETTFDPNAVCTRGQIVTFLFRASGDEKVATGTDFADVASGSYCADAVAWAVANKVANGFADGTFRPEATCTRGQAVTFIYRALAE